MKIAHIADTHIKNLKYHDEYREVFFKIYDILKQENVELIIHCGDIAHTKTQISPEFVEMAGDFFSNLASIAPTHIILGNHDVNLKNESRQDSISPIIKALNLPNLFLHKYSGEISINNHISLNVMSIIDEDKWVRPSNAEKINIGLYHGAINGITTDTGYRLEEGIHLVDVYEGHDYVFLGDIHKTNQFIDKEGKVRYPGSTVQQGFAETDDKGFLIWDIKDKNDFTCKHYAISNPRPYINIYLDSMGDVPAADIVLGARIRVIADKSVSLDKVKKALEIVKSKYQPESVAFVNKAIVSKDTTTANTIQHAENLRDLGIQEKLIREYLKDFKAEEEVINKVLELNKKFSSSLEESEDILRNIKWKIKSLEWDNLFNYGEGNKIDFEKLSGVVGIFGKNYSGKSSIVDGLLYTVFNTTSKNNRKNLNVINQNAELGRGKIEIDIDGENYTIERKSEKYSKKSKGVETLEAKTDVQFISDAASLNGLARNDTDKNIRKFFGSVDDFFLTSMASQFGYLSFITEGSTKRKEILAKFLDLENFEKKFKMAKEEGSELKVLLKKLEGVDYRRDIANAELQLQLLQEQIDSKLINTFTEKQKVIDLTANLQDLQREIDNIPQEFIDFDDINHQLSIRNVQKKNLTDDNVSLLVDFTKCSELVTKIDEFISSIDENELRAKEQQLEVLNQEISKLEKVFSSLEIELKNTTHKMKLLDGIPCGDTFPNCKFIKDAFESKKKHIVLTSNYNDIGINLKNKNTSYDVLDQSASDNRNKLSEISKKRAITHERLSSYELKIQKNNNLLLQLDIEIKEYQEKMNIYLANAKAVANYEDLIQRRSIIRQSIDQHGKLIASLEQESLNLHKEHASVAAKCDIFRQQMEELERIRKDYAAYDLLLKCMHPNGISYEIIKNKLPEINQEIAKILTNIVDFSIYLENDEDKLDIMIKHPRFDARPLEMGSGAEKTLASTAIRLALISVTTLPIPDIFIMDEPGTALDGENLEGFTKILELTKGYFKTVILISHLDSLKDSVDRQIVIERKDGFAHVNM
jgi:DNA repair exonuclease SbcCD ATPase subunit/DNA repair exonuclease SbcCD nuclease subunit